MTRTFIVFAAAAMLLPSVAGAKARVYGKPSEALAVQAQQNFARCIVDRTPQGAEKVLAMDFRTKDYKQALNRLGKGHENCLKGGDRMQSNGVLLAGGLAEALMDHQRITPHLARYVAYDASKPPIEARGPTEVIAMCIVRAEPDKVAALFGTEATSEAEDRIMQSLGATIVKCVPAGQTIRLNRPGLRALVALAAYRLVKAGAA